MIRLRDITPRGLYARTLLLLLVPLSLLLALMTWYYYDSHIAEVNRKLAQSLARDTSLIQAYCLIGNDLATTHDALEEKLDLDFVCQRSEAPEDNRLMVQFPYGGTLRDELASRLEVPVYVGLDRTDSMIHVRFPVTEGEVEARFERKRALTVNSHFFIVWVILASFFLVALAIGFLNQQVRSILRLSEAARAFGRGREMPEFRPAGATEVRDAARAVIDMKNRLTAFTNQRTAMLAGVSHDLRTPLTRLKLALAMMDETDDIKAARADLDDMGMMLNEYLNFARGEEGDDPEELDIGALVRDVASGFGSHVQVDGPASVHIMGRPLALKRAVTNLISNGLKYAGHVDVELMDGPRAVEIHIDDDGPGIAEDLREEAFRPFSRLDDARSQNAPGTGLGLTLARDTARAHGGDVRLSDSPLGGLRASLRLPH